MESLAAAVLEEVPYQVTSYFRSVGVKPTSAPTAANMQDFYSKFITLTWFNILDGVGNVLQNTGILNGLVNPNPSTKPGNGYASAKEMKPYQPPIQNINVNYPT